MQQDPRFQGDGADDQFLAEQDPQHEMNVARAQQEAEMAQYEQQVPQQRKPSRVHNLISNISNLGGGGRRPQQQVMGYDEYGRPMVQQVQQQVRRPQVQDMRPREPKVSLFGGKSTILNAPHIFNNPGQSNLAKRRL